MKLQKNTLILMGIAIIFAGGVYWMETRGKFPSTSVQTSSVKLFNFKTDEVQSLSIKTPENNITLMKKKDAKDQDKSWEMKTPIQVLADEAAITFLLDKLITEKSERTLSVSASQLSEFGLSQPQEDVEITLSTGKTHRLILGNSDFSSKFIYGQIDPPLTPSQNASIVLINVDLRSAISRPLADWKYDKPKPSPSSSISPSPSNSPGVSPSNSPSVSPSNSPSVSPSNSPSISPSNSPSISPSNSPSISPSNSPSVSPSNSP